MNIRFSPEALNDLDEIYSYIADKLKNPVAAENAVNQLLDKAKLLADEPEMGKMLFFDDDLFSGYRYIISDNYLAFYRIGGANVYIDKVIYGKRNYMKLLFK